MVPLQLSYKDIPASEAITAAIEERANKLEKYFQGIISCNVIVREPHQRHIKGNIYHIHVQIKLPKHEIVVSREPEKNSAHADIYIAIRDVFDTAERQL